MSVLWRHFLYWGFLLSDNFEQHGYLRCWVRIGDNLVLSPTSDIYTIPLKARSVSTRRGRKERKSWRQGEGLKCHLLGMTQPTYCDLTGPAAAYNGPANSKSWVWEGLMGPWPCLPNYWLLMDSGWEEDIFFYVPTYETTEIQCLVPNARSQR